MNGSAGSTKYHFHFASESYSYEWARVLARGIPPIFPSSHKCTSTVQGLAGPINKVVQLDLLMRYPHWRLLRMTVKSFHGHKMSAHTKFDEPSSGLIKSREPKRFVAT